MRSILKFAVAIVVIAVLVTAFCIASFKGESQPPQLTSAIELKPNTYASPDDLDARMDLPIRQVVFYWAFEAQEPELPLFSAVLVQKNYVATLIDSVAAVHLQPKPNFYTGAERRFVGVSIHEPLSRTSSYKVPTVDWVAVYSWHRN